MTEGNENGPEGMDAPAKPDRQVVAVAATALALFRRDYFCRLHCGSRAGRRNFYRPGMSPMGDGSGSFVFADWCSSADRDPRIGDDPAMGQYHEAYCVFYGLFEEKKVSRIPYIWVDSELSLIRGHVQGFPKKLGDIFMTRPVEIGRGGARKAIGSRFAAHVSQLGRRLVTLSVTLEETVRGILSAVSGDDRRSTRASSHRSTVTEPSVHEFQRAKVADFALGTVFQRLRNPRIRPIRVQRDRLSGSCQRAARPCSFHGLLGGGRHRSAGRGRAMSVSRRPPPGAAPHPARRQARVVRAGRRDACAGRRSQAAGTGRRSICRPASRARSSACT